MISRTILVRRPLRRPPRYHVRFLCISVSLVLVTSHTNASPNASSNVSSGLEIQRRESGLRLERIKEDPRYLQTRLLCENNWREYGWLLKESAAEVLFLGTADAQAWSRFFGNLRIAPEVKDLLDSEPFSQALLDCGEADSVISKMAAADYAGKVVGFGATYFLWRSSASLLMRLSKLGHAGFGAQRAALVLGFAYTVHQGFMLAAIVRHRNLTKSESKALVDQKQHAMQQHISRLRQEVEDGFRKELALLETEFQSPNLSDLERRSIREKIERIRFALNANNSGR